MLTQLEKDYVRIKINRYLVYADPDYSGWIKTQRDRFLEDNHIRSDDVETLRFVNNHTKYGGNGKYGTLITFDESKPLPKEVATISIEQTSGKMYVLNDDEWVEVGNILNVS